MKNDMNSITVSGVVSKMSSGITHRKVQYININIINTMVEGGMVYKNFIPCSMYGEDLSLYIDKIKEGDSITISGYLYGKENVVKTLDSLSSPTSDLVTRRFFKVIIKSIKYENQ